MRRCPCELQDVTGLCVDGWLCTYVAVLSVYLVAFIVLCGASQMDSCVYVWYVLLYKVVCFTVSPCIKL